MQITFAGTIIAREPDFNGFDSVTGFEPDGELLVQQEPLLRGKWQKLLGGDNAIMTMTGEIVPPAEDTIGDAIFAYLMWMSTMPTSGPLTFEADGVRTTFPVAKLKRCRALKHQGVSYAIELTFVGVNPSQDNIVTDSSGDTVTDSSGAAVTDSSS